MLGLCCFSPRGRPFVEKKPAGSCGQTSLAHQRCRLLYLYCKNLRSCCAQRAGGPIRGALFCLLFFYKRTAPLERKPIQAYTPTGFEHLWGVAGVAQRDCGLSYLHATAKCQTIPNKALTPTQVIIPILIRCMATSEIIIQARAT